MPLTKEREQGEALIQADQSARVDVQEITYGDGRRVLEAYALLHDVLGAGAVEDKDSFLRSVSPETDAAVVPRLVCAIQGSQVLGVALGAYLRNLNMGMILYGAVAAGVRRRGTYTKLRSRLVSAFNRDARAGRPNGPESETTDSEVVYVISEVDQDSQLFRQYVVERGAFVAPCDYEQPATQGLLPRRLKLVLQPIARRVPPSRDELESIVREIYERIYRLPDVGRDTQFRRIVESIRPGYMNQAGP